MRVLVLVLLLVGCASSEPYDQQFCTLSTVSNDGVERCHAWQFGPSIRQQIQFRRHGL
jgi:hypothetical protein